MPRWNVFTEDKLSRVTGVLKRKRVELFVRTLDLGRHDVVLDLGSEDGSCLAEYYPYPNNIVLADVREEPMEAGVSRYGLKGHIVIPEDGPLPIRNDEYDAVWCNSVIEHVTVPPRMLASISNHEFQRQAEQHQRRFAGEIRRIARRYFVQTPYVHFPIEAHSWIPGAQYLSHTGRLMLARLSNRVWLKQWYPDFLLFNQVRFRRLFWDAQVFRIERVFGIPKSLIAIRSE